MEARKKIIRDIILYTIFVILLVLFYIFIIPNQIKISIAAKADSFSPDTFPRLITKVMIFVSSVGLVYSIIRLIMNIKEYGRAEKGSDGLSKGKLLQALIPFIVVILILLYIICFDKIGFILSTAIFPPLILFVIGGRNWKHYLIYFCFAALMYVLFKYLMLVPIR